MGTQERQDGPHRKVLRDGDTWVTAHVSPPFKASGILTVEARVGGVFMTGLFLSPAAWASLRETFQRGTPEAYGLRAWLCQHHLDAKRATELEARAAAASAHAKATAG